MSVRVQHRRGSIAAHASFVGAEGELTWATDEKRWIGHDAATPGGIPAARKDEVTAEALRQIGNANFSFQVTDRLVTPNAAFTAARTGTLPLASAVAAGRGIVFFDALPAINGSNILTVARSGSDTINGATSYSCAMPRGRWEFVSDGVSKWSVTIGLETRLRVDTAQGLTSGEQLQARQNAGLSSAGDAMATAANVAAQRALLDQKWVTIADETLAANATQFTDVVLGSYSRFRLTLIVAGNPAVADFFVGWRGSTDGTTFPSGGSDYTYEVNQALAAVGSAINGNAAGGFMTSIIDTGNSPAIPCEAGHTFFKGSASSRAMMRGGSFAYSTNWVLESQGSIYNTTAALTHLRIFASVASALGIGSRLIVEGC